jgi:hypothetical protein|tara:strand:- start:407 stop:685 length:279 start_codon:yes stop_codon:yes gene_type:complete
MQSKLSQATGSTGTGRGSDFFLLASEDGELCEGAMERIDTEGDWVVESGDCVFVLSSFFDSVPHKHPLNNVSTGVEALCNCSSREVPWCRLS